jgi:hypothetical protein
MHGKSSPVYFATNQLSYLIKRRNDEDFLGQGQEFEFLGFESGQTRRRGGVGSSALERARRRTSNNIRPCCVYHSPVAVLLSMLRPGNQNTTPNIPSPVRLPPFADWRFTTVAQARR